MISHLEAVTRRENRPRVGPPVTDDHRRWKRPHADRQTARVEGLDTATSRAQRGPTGPNWECGKAKCSPGDVRRPANRASAEPEPRRPLSDRRKLQWVRRGGSRSQMRPPRTEGTDCRCM